MKKKPVIGILLDWQKSGTFSKRPHYALREDYFNAIYLSGGLPIAIPHIKKLGYLYLQKIDGLLVPGGDFSSPKEWYKNQKDMPKNYQASIRPDFDIDMIKGALKLNKPFLGICAGMQTLAGIYGAKLGLIQNHKQTDKRYAHRINIKPDTLLGQIVGQKSFMVNSRHQEAILHASPKIKVGAVADDGLIEAIELPNFKFCLGVQWHPEDLITKKEEPSFWLFNRFVNLARSESTTV